MIKGIWYCPNIIESFGFVLLLHTDWLEQDFYHPPPPLCTRPENQCQQINILRPRLTIMEQSPQRCVPGPLTFGPQKAIEDGLFRTAFD